MVIPSLLLLQNLPGRIHIVFDGWSTPNILSTLGIVAIFEKDGKIYTMTLDVLQYVPYTCSVLFLTTF